MMDAFIVVLEAAVVLGAIVLGVKTGGLGDVVGALPAALAPHDVNVVTLVPGYPRVMAAVRDSAVLHDWPDLIGAPARLLPRMRYKMAVRREKRYSLKLPGLAASS